MSPKKIAVSPENICWDNYFKENLIYLKSPKRSLSNTTEQPTTVLLMYNSIRFPSPELKIHAHNDLNKYVESIFPEQEMLSS